MTLTVTVRACRLFQEEYILKWRDYQTNFFELAEDLFMNELLTDVTLCCRDQAGLIMFIADFIISTKKCTFCRKILNVSVESASNNQPTHLTHPSHQTFEAHRLVLSVCSTYFRSVFTSAHLRQRGGQGHPVIFIKVSTVNSLLVSSYF